MSRMHDGHQAWEAFDILVDLETKGTAENSAQFALGYGAQRIWEKSITAEIVAKSHLEAGRLTEAAQAIAQAEGMRGGALELLQFLKELKQETL